ncbi:hypothetical protein BKA62DRAFT_765950 [Auriculariales sp. MPI-PUGE-AT-0066]|nr:hypothetical protein BKA62DRAFT_765950 [Auriculariales sp. MPI-PUGE-AT-0066]
MRIATSNIQAYVSHALKFLEENPDIPLVLHTLPAEHKSNESNEPSSSSATLAVEKKRKRGQDDDVSSISAKAQKTDDGAINSSKKKKIQLCTDSVGRLVSVVEIIQREYLKLRKTGEIGLHQYNQLSTLEEEGLAPQTEELDPLDAALQGKKHTKIKVTPFMRITLCTQELPDLVKQGQTYQGEPPTKKKTKRQRHTTGRNDEKRLVKWLSTPTCLRLDCLFGLSIGVDSVY